MRTKVAIVKLAAIGDVVLACRALNEFTRRYNAHAEFHWIIDQGLAGLARALVSAEAEVHWHPIDSGRLFRGKPSEKAREAIGMLGVIRRERPDQLLLLHRDWRYKALLRPAFRGSLFSVERARRSELDAYNEIFDALARKLHAPSFDEEPSPPASFPPPSGKIGVLVGGARNQKVDYAEKRWPRLSEFVELLIVRTTKTVVLFGAPDDLPQAQAILARLPHTNRVENLVGRTPLELVPRALERLDAFVSIDSGLAHIAAAVMRAPHQRVVTLFGPTDPRVWAPVPTGEASAVLHYKSRACSPCYAEDGAFKPCKFEGKYFQHCMFDISPEAVLRSLA